MFRLAKCTVRAEKGTRSASKRGTESFISDTSLCGVALMTRFNAYVSAARARNTDARPSLAAPGWHQSPKCEL